MQLYHNLVQSRSVNVKQSLAASLHEVAKILSTSYDIEDELVPVFEEMIQVLRGAFSFLIVAGRGASSDGCY